MAGNATPGQSETAATSDDKLPSEETSRLAKPGQPDAPRDVQPVDQAAQEEAAEERATNGGYN
jgi:hypothetical protein